MTLFTEDLYGKSLGSEAGSLGVLKDFHVSLPDWQVREFVCSHWKWVTRRTIAIDTDAVLEFHPGPAGIQITSGDSGRSAGDLVPFAAACEALTGENPGRKATVAGRLTGLRGIKGCSVEASDGHLGVVTGFMVDLATWKVSEIVVESGKWYTGKQFLVSPGLVAEWNPDASEMHLKQTRSEISRTWIQAEERGLV